MARVALEPELPPAPAQVPPRLAQIRRAPQPPPLRFLRGSSERRPPPLCSAPPPSGVLATASASASATCPRWRAPSAGCPTDWLSGRARPACPAALRLASRTAVEVYRFGRSRADSSTKQKLLPLAGPVFSMISSACGPRFSMSGRLAASSCESQMALLSAAPPLVS